MSRANRCWNVALSIVLWVAVPLQLASSERASDQAEKMFEARLGELKNSDRGRKSKLQATCLARSFEDCHFFLLRHGVYPIGVQPEPPLKTNNVFAVSGNMVVMITDEKELEQFFKDNLASIEGEAAVTE